MFGVCSKGSNQQYSSIGSDNDFVPTMRQAIMQTNDDKNADAYIRNLASPKQVDNRYYLLNECWFWNINKWLHHMELYFDVKCGFEKLNSKYTCIFSYIEIETARKIEILTRKKQCLIYPAYSKSRLLM